MPASLYIRPYPRAFFLITETSALVFRQPSSQESKATRSVVIAEFLPVQEVNLGDLIPAGRRRTIDGVLGVTCVPTARSPIPEIFLCLISSSTPLSPLIPQSSLRPARILEVEFHSLSSSFWDPPELTSSSASFHESYDSYGETQDPPISRSASSSTLSQAAQQNVENPCSSMRKYLESGGFYFAEKCKWDISNRLLRTNWVKAEKGLAEHPLETFDERFIWNANLLAPLLSFRSGLPVSSRRALDNESLLIPVIQGFCSSRPVSTSNWDDSGPVAALGIISRLSWKRAGTRFRSRGVDDNGQVANFVETEVILALEAVCMSHVQVRGSVPLFWTQPTQGIQTLQQKVEITRPVEATQPAFDKHFMELMERYHSVHAINLLGHKEAEERLSQAYRFHFDRLQSSVDATSASEKNDASGRLELTEYDVHAQMRVGGHDAVRNDFAGRVIDVARSMREFGWTSVDAGTGEVIEAQTGVFRVNCLDCLDRTNLVEDAISSLTLMTFLNSMGSPLVSSESLRATQATIWADNGDALAKIYTGTGAINTSTTRSGKQTFGGLLSDARKSVTRAYYNNFTDKDKQDSIDMLLGQMAGQEPVILFDPIGDSVQSALAARVNEYSSTRIVSIFSGTWNVNGKVPDEALNRWLFPPDTAQADIYMIGFQEIVELNASQVLNTDPTKRKIWENYIMDTFDKQSDRRGQYLLFQSEQLVGTALILVVKSSLIGNIRNVEKATKKTGLSGLSGNKGGVGIRFDLCDSTVCLMTCHLAAGHDKVAERNADYGVISNGLRFLRGKMIDTHDIVIWCADFNYRINLDNALVRDSILEGSMLELSHADQLQNAMNDGDVFVGYEEGPITFMPTYKYDIGTDQYDTSEKSRIPAWTDRVIFKGEALRLKEYNRAELRMSDHRPVYAVFDATIREVNHAAKEQITKDITNSIRRKVGNGRVDDKVENGLSNGRLDRLVGKLTNESLSTTRSTSPLIKPPPPPPARAPALPPRPKPVGGLSFEDDFFPPAMKSDFSRLQIDPQARRSSVPSPSFAPQSSTRPEIPDRLPSKEIVNPDSRIQMPPSSYKSPTLPTRFSPNLQHALDMDETPPIGLPAPVLPDNFRYVPVPSSRSSAPNDPLTDQLRMASPPSLRSDSSSGPFNKSSSPPTSPYPLSNGRSPVRRKPVPSDIGLSLASGESGASPISLVKQRIQAFSAPTQPPTVTSGKSSTGNDFSKVENPRNGPPLPRRPSSSIASQTKPPLTALPSKPSPNLISEPTSPISTVSVDNPKKLPPVKPQKPPALREKSFRSDL